MSQYFRDRYQGAGAIAANAPAPRSAPAPSVGRRALAGPGIVHVGGMLASRLLTPKIVVRVAPLQLQPQLPTGRPGVVPTLPPPGTGTGTGTSLWPVPPRPPTPPFVPPPPRPRRPAPPSYNPPIGPPLYTAPQPAPLAPTTTPIDDGSEGAVPIVVQQPFNEQSLPTTLPTTSSSKLSTKTLVIAGAAAVGLYLLFKKR